MSTTRLTTCQALVRVQVRMNLLKHFVEISSYLGVFLDECLELENDRRKLLLNVTRSRTSTVLDKLNKQLALELADGVGVLGEPSGDGTTTFYLKRHVD